MTKKTVSLAAITLLAAVVVWLLIALPTDRQLVATDSTHENIQYLTVDAPELKEGRQLRFAAYDADCGTVQLCFAVKKGDRAFWQAKDLAITVSGTTAEKWEHLTHSTWKRDYFSILLAGVAPDAQITFTYGGQTITIQ